MNIYIDEIISVYLFHNMTFNKIFEIMLLLQSVTFISNRFVTSKRRQGNYAFC